jgi:uncharacterized SAM-binding protein YcdF (DUF218 family)
MIFGPLRLALKIVSVVITLVFLYFGVTFVQIWLRGHEHSSANAQAILVFGTAAGITPSPELQDRLNHAYALFTSGRAPYIAVTGGKLPTDTYTEAHVSATYLEGLGVPSDKILQGGGGDTWGNVAAILPELKSHDITTVITVTDPFHEYRAMAICTDQGLTAYPSPISVTAVSGSELWKYYLTETIEVGVARVVGYHTVSNWIHDG